MPRSLPTTVRDATPAEPPAPTERGRPWWRAGVSSVFVRAVFGWFLHSSKVDLGSLGRKLSEIPVWVVALVFVGACGEVLLQGARFWALFPPATRPRALELLRVFSAGQIVNAVAPARSGDLLKVVLLRRLPAGAKDGIAGLVGLLATDKLADLAAIVIVLASSGPALHALLTRVPVPPVWSLVAAGVGLAAVVVLARASLSGRAAKLRASARGFLHGCSALKHPTQIVASVGFAVGSWLVELVMLRGLCGAMGHPLSHGGAVVALLTLNLGIAIPVTVGNLGVFEAALGFGLTLNGVPIEVAIPVATLHHVLQIAGVAALALITSVRLPKREAASAVVDQVHAAPAQRAAACGTATSGP